MTDKTLKQMIDKATIMAKLIKTEEHSDKSLIEKPKDFDDASTKAIDSIINGRTGERGICIYFPLAGKLPDNLKPVDSSTNQTENVEIGSLYRLDKSIALIMRSLNEISIHPSTQDFRHESVDDLFLELQNLRAKIQDNTYDKYLTKQFICVVAKIDLQITSQTETMVSVEIARTEGIKNKAPLELIHGFTYYF